MLDKLLQCNDAEIKTHHKKFQTLKEAYISSIAAMAKPSPKKKRRSITFHEGVASGYAILTVYYNSIGKKEKSSEFLKLLLELKTETLQTESNEILYGKAGYLLALLYVQRHIATAIPAATISSVYDAIIAAGHKSVELALLCPQLTNLI